MQAPMRPDKLAKEPVFNVPGVVLAVLAIWIAVHVVRINLGEADGLWLLLAMAFIPARYAGMAATLPGGDVASVTSFVTHMFAHGDAIHLAINSAWFLAFGSVMSRRLGALRFLAFAICGGIAGALAFLALHPGLLAPVIGASGAVSALMGGVMRFLFNAIDRHQGYLLRDNPALIARMSLTETLSDRRIVIASVVFVVLNLLAIVGFGTLGAVGAIAWEAHLGGYFFGLFAFALLDVAPQKASPYSGELD